MKKLLTILIILTVFFAFDIPSVVEAQSSNQAPSAEQPQAGKKDEDKPEARNRDKKKKARPSPSPTTEQSSTQTTSLFQIIVKRVFSIIPDVTSSPAPHPSTTPQTRGEAPQGEQPRAEEKKDDNSRTKRSEKKKASPSPSPTPTSTLASTQTSVSVGKIKKTNLQYPIKELGNCKSEADCKKYCDLKENIKKCAEFGKKTGLMTAQEAEVAQVLVNTTNGPGGCTDKESCAKVCDDPKNTNACLEYAKKNNLMTDDELEKAKKVAGIISAGSKTPGGCQTPQACRGYCTGGDHVDECIEFARGAGLISGDEAKEMGKGRDFLKNGGPGGCKSREKCEAYCEDDSHQSECEAFFKKAGVPDRKPMDKSGKPPKTGGGAVCTTREECEAFCKNPANAETCKNVVIKGGQTTGPEIQGDIGKLLENINQMPQESKECLKGALGAETFEKLMRGEMPTSPIGGDVMQSCFAKGIEEYEQKAMPTKKPDDFSLEYGPGPSSQAIPGGVPEEIPPGQPGEAGGVPEVQGVSVTPSLLDKILDWLRR